MSSPSCVNDNDQNMKEETPTIKDNSSSLRVPPFLPNQRVWCLDNDKKLYEAVIRKSSWTGQHWKFFVHYLGWNARWDKWVDEFLLRQDSEQVRQEAKDLQQAKKRSASEQENDTTSTTTTTMSSSARKKRVVSKGPSYADYCELPFSLKTILVDDKEKIMRSCHENTENYSTTHKMVHNLPAKVTIKQVLSHFVKCQKKQFDGDLEKTQQAEVKARTFVQDLGALFDVSLAKCLLYPPERAQFSALQTTLLKGRRPSEVYGCEFLLRLLVRLPVLLEHTAATQRKVVGMQCQDLILLLQKNRQACFKARYREYKTKSVPRQTSSIVPTTVAMDE